MPKYLPLVPCLDLVHLLITKNVKSPIVLVILALIILALVIIGTIPVASSTSNGGVF